MDTNDLSGTWCSRYVYESSSDGKSHTDEHEVALELIDGSITVKSNPHPDGSLFIINLTGDGNVFTGTWREQASPTGIYKGAIFHGAIQLILSDDGRKLTGCWVGFNSARTRVKTGEWTLTKLK